MTDSRERFEKWARDWFGSEDVPVEYDSLEECYQHLAAHSAWGAWQAAERQMLERVIEKIAFVQASVPMGSREMIVLKSMADALRKEMP